MKIIEGKGATLGRLASFAAKEALKGEEIIILNCTEVIISGGNKNIEREFFEKRNRHGASQKGPIYPSQAEKIVKRTIRGMLPDHRKGRGRVAFKKIRCYNKVPAEYEEKEKIEMKKDKLKYIKVGDIKK